MLEENMVQIAFDYYIKLNKYKKIVREVPFLSRCIDLVLVTEDNRIITIEFKMNKWRDAIKQAENHKLGADISYICIPKRKITNVLKETIKNSNVGLLFFDNDSDDKVCEIYSSEKENTNVNIFRDLLVSNISKVSTSLNSVKQDKYNKK